jgi:4-hydroxybenzoate polyprenyltransferase
MLILPLVDLYATACDWWVGGRQRPAGLYWFLIVSYLNGIVIEVGRKTRVPTDEERGVETYSALWGMHRAVRAWLGAVLLTAAAAWQASARIGTQAPTLVLLGVLAVGCAMVARRFMNSATPGSGRWIELMSGVWTILMYVGLGAAPLAITLWRAKG